MLQYSYAGSLRLSAQSSAVELSLLLVPSLGHLWIRQSTNRPVWTGRAFTCLFGGATQHFGQICPEICGIEDGIAESWKWYSCFSWNGIVPDLDEVMGTQQCQRDSEDLDACGQ